jgi:lactate dehydrogenase-like 2-hydroxyacid dehydrogenase
MLDKVVLVNNPITLAALERLVSEVEVRMPYTPYGPTESTAEHVLLLMLATARRLPKLDRAVRRGDFELRARPEAMGHELADLFCEESL